MSIRVFEKSDYDNTIVEYYEVEDVIGNVVYFDDGDSIEIDTARYDFEEV